MMDSDYRDRLVRAAEELEGMARRSHSQLSEARLNGKAQGVRLALSYFDEIDRVHSLPIGLCGNREDHQPHRVDGTPLSPYWCSADQEQRLPFAAERRKGA